MHNWCDNVLFVTGGKDLIKTFYDENKGDDDDLSFNKSVPLDDNDENWYESRIENWGTKWDASEVRYNYEVCYNEIGNYEFITAWRPPVPWFNTIVAKYPGLNFELSFSEQGMDFSGVIKGKDGEIYMNDEGCYGKYVSESESESESESDED